MNKKYKILKGIDIIGQMASFLVPLIATLIIKGTYLDMLLSLLTLGKWQFFSFLIHLLFIRQPWISKFRKLYGFCLLGVFVFFISSFVFFPVMFLLLGYMLYIGSAMALFYFIISIMEWENMKLATTPTIAETTDRDGLL